MSSSFEMTRSSIFITVSRRSRSSASSSAAQLHRLLARLDPRLPPRRVGLSLSLVEEPGADAPRILDPRPAEQPDREQRSDESNRDSDHDCHRDGHGRSYGFGHPHAALPADRRFPARSRAPFSVSVQGVCLGGLWRCQADR